jgi:hypothetical protein
MVAEEIVHLVTVLKLKSYKEMYGSMVVKHALSYDVMFMCRTRKCTAVLNKDAWFPNTTSGRAFVMQLLVFPEQEEGRAFVMKLLVFPEQEGVTFAVYSCYTNNKYIVF